MAFLYEVTLNATLYGKAVANIFHVVDRLETGTPNGIIASFSTTYLVDILPFITNDYVFTEILVDPLDAINPNLPAGGSFSIPGLVLSEGTSEGLHCWVKLNNADPNERAGGKMVGGIADVFIADGRLTSVFLDDIQIVFQNLQADLVANDYSLAIYREKDSLPGFPAYAEVASVAVRGTGTNNRRMRDKER